MLERLAELVWEQDKCTTYTIPCAACKYEKGNCMDEMCPTIGSKDGSLMLARWAVLLLAQALEKEVVDYEIVDKLECRYDADRAAMHIGLRLLDLLEEANPKNKEAGAL